MSQAADWRWVFLLNVPLGALWLLLGLAWLHETPIDPTARFDWVGWLLLILIYVAVALGGFGSILGSLLAGVLIGLIESVGGLLLDPSYKTLIVFGLYLAVVIVRPQGLFGRF